MSAVPEGLVVMSDAHSDVVVFCFDVSPGDGLASLTAAERDVALGMLRGESNAEIATRRGGSVRTVANQAAALRKKLGVASRGELAARAIELFFTGPERTAV